MATTNQQYLDMLSRLNRNKIRGESSDDMEGCEKESELHADILRYCQQHGWIALHGSMAHRAMRTKGEFDFSILADGGRVFFIEAKTATGKLSPEQAGMILWAEKLGHKPAVVRSFDEFLTLINNPKEP